MTDELHKEDLWWFGSKEGVSEEVAPPWTPLRLEQGVDSIRISPWGRRYDFGPSVFPDKIQSRGRSILAEPIRIVARANGETQEWQADSISLEEKTPARIVFSQKAVSSALVLSARTQVEYDGVVRIDWKVEPRRPVTLEQLTFELSLNRENARYLYHYPGTWGTPDVGSLPEKTFVISAPLLGLDEKRHGNIQGFRPLIWLGDEERGLAWFSESDKNWYTNDAANVIEIVTEGDKVTLKLHLVSIPLELSPEGKSSEDNKMIPPEEGPLANLTYTFGLQATPVKPVTKDVWDYRITHMNQDTYGPPEMRLKIPESVLDKLASFGVRTVCFHEHWADAEGYFMTPHGEDLKWLVNACHERGIQFLPYLGFLISELANEWPQVGEQCKALPEYGTPAYRPYDCPPQPVQYAHIVCYNSVWQDAVVAGIGRLMDEYDVDGVYLDGTAQPFGCLNRAHGCGYMRPNGEMALTYPIFAVRNLMRRIYNVVRSRRPDGQVNVHNSTAMPIPTLSYATSTWDGEQFGKNIDPATFALDTLPLDAFRTEFMGHQWGVPAEFLCRGAAPFSRQDCYAFTLLHDVLIREGYENHSELLDLQSRLWRLSDEFGRREATWLPYWNNEEFVTASPEGAYASLYNHPKNGVLAVISNLSRDHATVGVQLHLDKLGLRAKGLSASDALTNEPVEMKDGNIQLSLPSLGWRLVWLKS